MRKRRKIRMRAWAGRREDVPAAKQAFYRGVKVNALTRDDKWNPELQRAS